MDLTIIIPTHSEGENIRGLLKGIRVAVSEDQ